MISGSRSVVLIVLCVAVVGYGCSNPDMNPISPPVQGGNVWGSLFSLPPADAYLVTYSSRTNAYGGATADDNQQWMYFYNSGTPVRANSVTVNGNSLETALGYQAGSYPLTFGTGYHTWSVTGNASVPTYTHSVTPPSRFTITSPDTGVDTVDVSTGITITHTSPGTDSVLVRVMYELGISNREDSAASDTPWMYMDMYDNTGSITLSPSNLSGLSGSGFTMIQILAAKTDVKIVESKTCLAVAATASTVLLRFKP